MHRCKCVTADVKIPDWYPARLISLEELKKLDRMEKNTLISTRGLETWEHNRQVRLVETKFWKGRGPGHSNVRYVTLSHCWGKNPSTAHQLTADTMDKYKAGVKLHTLPRTFRDAIKFAARLPHVGFIWIDSLCIIQRDEADWLVQSSTMEKVYLDTFLNISATHSNNIEGGLFRERDPESLLEDEVILNIAGLPGADKTGFSEAKQPSGLVNSSSRAKVASSLRRCTILDVSFWMNRVDRAPVNKRGWVLQERLMSPRVLHFCEDQVAWECREFDAAEGQPQDMPILHLAGTGVVEKSRLRGFDDIATGGSHVGEELRRSRLGGLDDPDPHLQPQIYALELWGRIVEQYSMTALTQPKDKLIALSGLARWISRGMEKCSKETGSPEYVAGLWTLHIESQLLWFVEPVFRESDSSFENRSTAPDKSIYRAPSFSWAAVDAHEMRGIKYAEVTDRDILIKVEEVGVVPQKGSDIFGILKDAHLVLRGKLRRAVIEGPNKQGRYGWRLVGRGELDDEEHRNVYLDCPERDTKITGLDADVFVVPVAKGNRLAPEHSKYLICLLLQLEPEGEHGRQNAFRRIGLTKLSPWADSKALDDTEITASGSRVRTGVPKILRVEDSDVDMPHQGGYDAKEGTHRILLV
jgi:hypothetical protein